MNSISIIAIIQITIVPNLRSFWLHPGDIERFNPQDTIQDATTDLILDRGSFLHNEVEFLLREELREPRNYFVILRAIAQGKRKMSEIINDTGFEKSHLARYLDILRSLRFVDKEIPVGEDIYCNLQRKAQIVVWGKESRRERFILFSRSGFTDGMRTLTVQNDVLLVAGLDV